MSKKTNKRKIVGLVCEETGRRDYYTTKNTVNSPEKIQLMKYNPLLKKKTLYVETRKNLGRNEV